MKKTVIDFSTEEREDDFFLGQRVSFSFLGKVEEGKIIRFSRLHLGGRTIITVERKPPDFNLILLATELQPL